MALPMFHLAVVFEKGHVVARGLNPQHDAMLVVHLDRALAEAVLDTGTLDPDGELRADLLQANRRFGPRPARRLYNDATREALIVVWEASDRVCGKRLRPLVPILIEAMERHGLHLAPEIHHRKLHVL